MQLRAGGKEGGQSTQGRSSGKENNVQRDNSGGLQRAPLKYSGEY